MKTNIYQILKTNMDETKNQITNKIEIVLGLKGEKYKIIDLKFCKNIICVSGTCDLCIEKSNTKETITLTQSDITIKLGKDMFAELKNCTKKPPFRRLFSLIYFTRWQATLWPGITSFRSGAHSRHLSQACGQRVWNTQPLNSSV